jgi:hypothetical protein
VKFHREFYYPARAKKPKDRQNLNDALNYGCGTWMTNVIHLPPSTMDGLLCKLEEDIDDVILKAVSIVGKNVGNDGQPIWVLNKEIAIDQHGNLVNNIKQHGLVWLSNLTEGNGVDIARAEYQADVVLPLSNQGFDTMCHFLKGTLHEACRENDEMTHYLEHVGFEVSDEMETTTIEENSSNQNFLSTFYLMSMACIMANYQEVYKRTVSVITRQKHD